MEKKNKQFSLHQSIDHWMTAECADFEANSRTQSINQSTIEWQRSAQTMRHTLVLNQSINHWITWECADFEANTGCADFGAYSRTFLYHIVFFRSHEVENMFCLVVVVQMIPCKTPVKKCAFSSFRKREITMWRGRRWKVLSYGQADVPLRFW